MSSRKQQSAAAGFTASMWLDADAAAAHLCLPSRKALYQRVRRGQVPAHRFGRSLRFNRAELDRVLGDGVTPLDDALRSALQRPSAERGG